MPKKLRKHRYCKNCASELNEANYCSDCGQQNTDKNVSLKVLFKDFADDYFEFDSKIFRSLKPLIFKPGLLTIEYISGKRASYILPLRMYLIISLLFFLIPSKDDPDLVQHTHIEKHVHGTDTSNTYINFKSDNNFDLNFKVNKNKIPGLDSLINKEDVTEEDIRPLVKAWLSKQGIDFEENPSSSKFVTFFMTKIIKIGLGNVSGFKGEFESTYPTLMFVLLPFFALLFKLFYLKLKKLYVEYLIFALHFHSFSFIALSVNDLLELMSIDIAPFFFLVLGVYLVMAMKKVYGQSLKLTIIKFLGILITYWIGFMIVMASAFFATLYLY